MGIELTPAFSFILPNGLLSSTLIFQERLSYNDYQLLFKYEFSAGSFTIIPQAGLKAFFIHQNIHPNYFGTEKDSGSGYNLVDFSNIFDIPNHYNGIGIAAGFETKWNLLWDITLNGQISKKRWRIEEYHKSIKQNASLEKSPTKVEKSQRNHIFAAIIAYCKLELLKIKTALNHFALKYKLLMKANKAALNELKNLRCYVR